GSMSTYCLPFVCGEADSGLRFASLATRDSAAWFGPGFREFAVVAADSWPALRASGIALAGSWRRTALAWALQSPELTRKETDGLLVLWRRRRRGAAPAARAVRQVRRRCAASGRRHALVGRLRVSRIGGVPAGAATRVARASPPLPARGPRRRRERGERGDAPLPDTRGRLARSNVGARPGPARAAERESPGSAPVAATLSAPGVPDCGR